MQGNGQVDVVEGTEAGTIYVLNGTNGSVVWSAADVRTRPRLARDGRPDRERVPRRHRPHDQRHRVFDGQSGQQVATLGAGISYQNSPLVTDDANGEVGITGAGGSVVTHWEIANSAGSNANEAGAWPQFHHDPQLTR